MKQGDAFALTTQLESSRPYGKHTLKPLRIGEPSTCFQHSQLDSRD